jgi:hypothetical protein
LRRIAVAPPLIAEIQKQELIAHSSKGFLA